MISYSYLKTSGAAKGYEDVLQGYTARSRQQSLDRRSGADRDPDVKSSVLKKEKEPSQKVSSSASENSKPPAVPKRKRDK